MHLLQKSWTIINSRVKQYLQSLWDQDKSSPVFFTPTSDISWGIVTDLRFRNQVIEGSRIAEKIIIIASVSKSGLGFIDWIGCNYINSIFKKVRWGQRRYGKNREGFSFGRRHYRGGASPSPSLRPEDLETRPQLQHYPQPEEPIQHSGRVPLIFIQHRQRTHHLLRYQILIATTNTQSI